MNMVLIVADTNGLIDMFRFRINIDMELQRLFGTYKIFVPPQVISELLRLRKRNRWAALALEYTKKRDICVSGLRRCVGEDAARVFKECKCNADEAIVRFVNAALSRDNSIEFYVLTNDRALRDRILHCGGNCLILRSRSHLEVL